MTCPGCDLPIKNSVDIVYCETGDPWHRICFDISVANLAAELESFMLSNPQEYRRLPNGNFVCVAE